MIAAVCLVVALVVAVNGYGFIAAKLAMWGMRA